MKRILNIIIFVYFIMGLFSCNKNTKVDSGKSVLEKNNIEIVNNEKSAVVSKQMQDGAVQENIEENIKIKEPLALYKEFLFEPIEVNNLSLVSILLEDDNSVSIYFDNKLVIRMDDFDFEISSVLNQCIPYNDERLFSCSFHLDSSDKNLYFGIISFKYGMVKVYKWLSKENMIGWPYYSGNSQYFIIEHDWTVKPASHDVLTYELIPAIYDGNILVYNIKTDKIEYYINSKILHENILLSIDKIGYDADGFRITLGNYYDSDEYVDFKLFTDNDNFRYEIYDKYSYSDE